VTDWGPPVQRSVRPRAEVTNVLFHFNEVRSDSPGQVEVESVLSPSRQALSTAKNKGLAMVTSVPRVLRRAYPKW
jgi:hypothetical protein